MPPRGREKWLAKTIIFSETILFYQTNKLKFFAAHAAGNAGGNNGFAQAILYIVGGGAFDAPYSKEFYLSRLHLTREVARSVCGETEGETPKRFMIASVLRLYKDVLHKPILK